MRSMNRRRFHLGAGLALTMGSGLFPGAHAQGYPGKLIKVIVPFAAGAPPDVFSRYWAERFSRAVRQPVIIENRPGASTIVGTQAFIRSAADGYTLLYTISSTLMTNPAVFKKLPYKVSDLVPVVRTLVIPFVLVVSASSPLQGIGDLVKAAKARDNAIHYASYGPATASHVVMVYFDNAAGVSLNHVPYKDGGLADVLGGRVDTAFSPIPDVLQHIRAGRLRALAVSSPRRLESLPNVPSLAEVYPGFDGDSWHGIFALKGTPQEVVDVVATRSQAIVASPEFRRYLAENGLVAAGGTPADFTRYIATDAGRWTKVIRDNDIALD